LLVESYFNICIIFSPYIVVYWCFIKK